MKLLPLLLAGAVAAQSQFPREYGYVPLADGEKLAYALYRPRAEGRFPTLLIYNMYDASAIAPEFNQTQTTEIREFLERGYAVMGANARGTACSTGLPDILHTEKVGRDGAEIVEWIARQRWSDARVGMFGHSGSGLTQLQVAAQQPPHLKAIVPGAAPVDFYRDLGYPGGLFNYAFIYHWTVDAQPAAEERAARVHIQAGDRDCAERRKSRPAPPSTFEQMNAHPLQDDWWRDRAPVRVANRIRTPAYFVFGWQDQNVDSRAVEIFEHFAGPKKMVLSEEEHSMYIRNPEVRRERLLFFDHWLKDAANGVMDGKPIVVWYGFEGAIERIPSRVGRYDRVPAPETQWTRYYLHPDRKLTLERPTTPSQMKYLYPLGSAFVYRQATHPHQPFGLGSLRFVTEPLAAETTLLGPSFVTLAVSSTEPDTSFQVVVTEIAAGGARKFLQRGYLRASLRQLDEEASRRTSMPQHAFREYQPLKPGEVVDLTIATNMTGTILRAGSRIELLIMAPNMAPEPIGQWGFLPLAMSTNTVHILRDRPSSLMLPVLPEKP